MGKLHFECTVHVHCAKNASIYTIIHFGGIETSLASECIPLFFIIKEIHFSACFLHVLHVLCMFCISACFLHVLCMLKPLRGINYPGSPKYLSASSAKYVNTCANQGVVYDLQRESKHRIKITLCTLSHGAWMNKHACASEQFVISVC